MCDYSLEFYSSRPASVHERYETTRFPSGSIGLAAPGDCKTAVCVQYDTTLHLIGIPAPLQASLAVGPEATATFVRLCRAAYRDGLRFADGREISLQQLGVGVGVVVTDPVESVKPAVAEYALV